MSWNVKKEEAVEIVSYEERKKAIRQQIKERMANDKQHLLLGIVGLPKTGKSGTAMDCRTEEEKKAGMKVLILDLDDGCTATWNSSWRDENIEIYVPNVLKTDGSWDWEQTFHNCHAWLEYANECVEQGNVKAVVLDGVDKVNEGSSDVLREALVKSNNKGQSIIHDIDSIKVQPLDWKIRNRVYNRILNPFIALKTNRILITHLKPIYENINVPTPVGFEPDWHKSTPQRLLQILTVSKIKRADKTLYRAVLDDCKTNPSLVGKSWNVFEVSKTDNKWVGIEEFKNGDFK